MADSSQSSTRHASSSTNCPILDIDQDEVEVRLDSQHASGAPESSGPNAKTTKTRSVTWEHCTKFEKPHEKTKKMWPYARFTYCEKEFPAHSSHNGTSAIKNHLIEKCVKCPIYKGGSNSEGQSILTQSTMGAPLVPHTLNQKKLEEAVYKWIIEDEHSFRAVEGGGFKVMIQQMCSKFKLPGRKNVATEILELYLMEKAKIKSVIGDQRVNITTDTWTSIQNINYMVVTAHFIDSDWKLHKRIINFTKINSHRGEDIGKTLELCLKGWGIDKVFSITVDNASANDGAVRYMGARLKDIDTLLLDGLYLHMRCSCHILNLIVKDGLDELIGSVDAIRNCVKFIRSSASRLDKFREFAILMKFGEMSNVPLDVVTRWNSTYKMLNSAIKFKMVFKRLTEEYIPLLTYFLETKHDRSKIRVGPPTDDDWEHAAALVHFLEIFYDATLALSATKTCTSVLIFDQISFLQCEIKLRTNDQNEVVRDVAHSMMMKFDKYWGSFQCINKLVYVAHVLNPRMKLQTIEIVFKDLGKGESEIRDIMKEVKGCMLNLYHAYKGESNVIVCPSAPVQMIEEAGLSRLKLMFKRKRMEEAAIEISNEVDKYLIDPFEKLDCEGFDLLQWWKCNQTWYPVLARIAKDLFSVPASTVASENAFSLGGRIVDPFRASLTPKVVEALVCTSDWFKAKEFNFCKEPNDEDIEFYKELKEIEIFSKEDLIPPVPILTRYRKEVGIKAFVKKEIFDPRLPDARRSSQINVLTTPKLCVQLNTLHYAISQLSKLENNIREQWTKKRPRENFKNKKSMDENSKVTLLKDPFNGSRKDINAAIDRICEFTGTKIIFWDLRESFIDNLYKPSVSQSRLEILIEPLDLVLNQLCDIIVEPLRDHIVTGLLQASMEGLLRVLLDGGPSRLFLPADAKLLEEDLELLKEFFISGGDGLPRGTVENQVSHVRNVIKLHGCETRVLIDDLKSASTSEMQGNRSKLGADTHTLLRLLGHRGDSEAPQFLKKQYKIPKSAS